MKTLWIVLRTLFYAGCGTFLFIAFVVATRGFDRRFENAFADWTRVPGILLTALGAVLMLLCMGTFVIRGRGTALVLDSPREFVASGPYRIVRNPLYIGSTTFFLGMGLCLRLPSAGSYLSTCLWSILRSQTCRGSSGLPTKPIGRGCPGGCLACAVRRELSDPAGSRYRRRTTLTLRPAALKRLPFGGSRDRVSRRKLWGLLWGLHRQLDTS